MWRPAALAAKLAVVLDELASAALSPSGIVAALNEAMLGIAPGDEVMFATGLYFRFERDLQRVTCCSFGHEGPIFSRAGPVRIRGGFPVGRRCSTDRGPRPCSTCRSWERGSWSSRTASRSSSTRTARCTRRKRLHEAFRRYADAPLEELVRGIVSELTSFRGTALVKDDRTLLALDLRGDAV